MRDALRMAAITGLGGGSYRRAGRQQTHLAPAPASPTPSPPLISTTPRWIKIVHLLEDFIQRAPRTVSKSYEPWGVCVGMGRQMGSTGTWRMCTSAAAHGRSGPTATCAEGSCSFKSSHGAFACSRSMCPRWLGPGSAACPLHGACAPLAHHCTSSPCTAVGGFTPVMFTGGCQVRKRNEFGEMK